MYQEAERVGSLIASLSRWGQSAEGTEVVFIDDGSTDGTVDVVERAMEDVDLEYRVVRHEKNSGKGAAIRSGVKEARGLVVVSVDADGSVHPTDVDRAVEALTRTSARLVVGNRRHSQSTIPAKQPISRRAAGRVFNYWVRILGLTKSGDTQCGLKAWYRDDSDTLLRSIPTGFAWDLALLHNAAQQDFEIAEIPVNWSHVDGSKVVPIRHGITMAADAVRVRFRSTIPRRSMAGLLLAVLLVGGFGLRLGGASMTDNADARTLAWGSSFVATGSLDPYREIIDNSLGDPIPLGGIRSLSLAHGPVGVFVGAVPLYVGDALGLLQLGEPPNGRLLGTGELFAYKLSYLVPELLVLVAIGRLVRARRSRLVAYAIWAFTPLAIFAWGQGMPDMWTISVVLWVMVWTRRAQSSAERSRRLSSYSWAVAITLIGALGTKLLPIILIIPISAVAFRDGQLTTRDKKRLFSISVLATGIAVLPYVLSPYLRANMLTRFEFAMLFDSGGIEVGSALYPAHLALVLMVAATLWMLANPADRYEAWTVAAVLVVATMSGVITHLMIWVLAAIVLVARRDATAAVGLGITTGLATAWHLLTYDWLSGLVLYTWDRSFPPAQVWPWINSHIPASNVIGASISSAVLLASLYAIGRVAFPSRGRHVEHSRIALRPGNRLQPGPRVSAIAMAGVAAIAVSVLLAVPLIAGRTGTEVWSFAYAGYPTDALVSIPRGGAWVSETMSGQDEVDHLTFTIDRSSQPSLDELVFSVRNETGDVVATASEPVWRAEPKSDQGPVRAVFDQPFQLDGNHLVIERRPGPAQTWDLPIGADGTFQPLNQPITNLTATSTREGRVRPTIAFYDDYFEESLAGLGDTLFDPGRLTGVAVSTLVVAAALWITLTRSTPGIVPVPAAGSRRHAIGTG